MPSSHTPSAIPSPTLRQYHKIGIVFLILAGIYGGIFYHDFHAHLKDEKIWIPFYEWVFGLTMPVERTYVFACVPFDRACLEFKIRHVRRGCHAVSLWIPNKEKDFTPIDVDMQLFCQVFSNRGELLFTMQRENSIDSGTWTWCRGKRGGSSEVFYKYRVPEDLPLDEELSMRIMALGDMAGFMLKYPSAMISVVKCSDK